MLKQLSNCLQKKFNLSIPLNVENFDIIVIKCDVPYATNCEFQVINLKIQTILFFKIILCKRIHMSKVLDLKHVLWDLR
jgi:hypothetical protein